MLSGRLPDFVIIGAMKCGTTSLHAMLGRHPQIFMSREKEITFFNRDRNWRRGEAWYRAHFRTRARLCGEASPPYTAWPRQRDVPERMRMLIPEARLVYVVRDPVARAFSHYKHRLSEVGPMGPPETAVLDDLFLTPSRYRTQLDRYLAAGFDMDRVHVVQAEALRSNRTEVLAELAAFLGVAYDPAMAAAPDRHDTAGKRLPGPRGVRLRRAAAPRLKRLPWSVRGPLEYALLRPFSRPMPDIALPDPARTRLAELLRPEADGLRALTGQRFEGWSV